MPSTPDRIRSYLSAVADETVNVSSPPWAAACWPMASALRDVLLIAEDAGREGEIRQTKARTDVTIDDAERPVLEASAGELLRFHDGVMAALEPFAQEYPAAAPAGEGEDELHWEPVPTPGSGT
jgi:hypothetical protein